MAMAEQVPGQPPRLRAVPPGTDTGTGGDTGAALVSPASVAPLSAADRAGVALRAVVSAARDLWLLPGRFLHAQAHPAPETMKEHWAHMQSRAWIPGEMTGRPEKAVAIAGILHHLVIAIPVKAAAKAVRFAAEKVDEIADRPLRFYGLLLFTVVLFVLLARYL
jgi:hypothetical protein